ncbi:ankyrin repeat domain-containing protein [Aspergillus lucknowensis]|uniref:Ankyrin n=1 Tax=Aspergillus lucknowensis TaxID=176173 RepID=A0ABR4LLE8_9EURO
MEPTQRSALLTAMKHRSLPLLELRVQYGADVNATGGYGFQTPLSEATTMDWYEGAQFLLEHGASVNDTPFYLAMSAEYQRYAPDELFSPLGSAINDGNKKMLALLLQHGADVLETAALDYSGSQSALMFALRLGVYIEIIDLLFAQLPESEKHPGWEKALKLVMGDLGDFETITQQRIIAKVQLPSLLPPRQSRRRGMHNLKMNGVIV